MDRSLPPRPPAGARSPFHPPAAAEIAGPGAQALARTATLRLGTRAPRRSAPPASVPRSSRAQGPRRGVTIVMNDDDQSGGGGGERLRFRTDLGVV